MSGGDVGVERDRRLRRLGATLRRGLIGWEEGEGDRCGRVTRGRWRGEWADGERLEMRNDVDMVWALGGVGGKGDGLGYEGEKRGGW